MSGCFQKLKVEGLFRENSFTGFAAQEDITADPSWDWTAVKYVYFDVSSLPLVRVRFPFFHLTLSNALQLSINRYEVLYFLTSSIMLKFYNGAYVPFPYTKFGCSCDSSDWWHPFSRSCSICNIIFCVHAVL